MKEQQDAIRQAAQAAAETLARQQAWQRAAASGQHQVVVDNQQTMRIVALLDLVVARGETVIALVSPYAVQPEASG